MGSHLFGDDFWSTITGKVEKEGALVKVVSLSRKAGNSEPFSKRKDERKPSWFFRGSPASLYGDRQGRASLPYNRHYQRGANNYQARPAPQRGLRPHFHEPALPLSHRPNHRRQ